MANISWMLITEGINGTEGNELCRTALVLLTALRRVLLCDLWHHHQTRQEREVQENSLVTASCFGQLLKTFQM